MRTKSSDVTPAIFTKQIEQTLYLEKGNKVIVLRAVGGFDRLDWNIITYQGKDYFVFTDKYELWFEVLALDWQSNSWSFVENELAKPIIDIFIKKGKK